MHVQIPVRSDEIEDNSRKIGALFAKLNSGDISRNAADKLVQLCQALDNGDFGTALQIQVRLWKLYSYILLLHYKRVIFNRGPFLFLLAIRCFLPLVNGTSATFGLQLSRG